MVWLIIVVVLALIFAAALLRDSEPAFPPKARRRNGKRRRVNVTQPAGDAAPDPSVFADSWYDDSDCATSADSGAADGCSDSSSSND
ncbi:MAG TPA: hypothetical protein VK358_04685 [Longimicrobium sp.]|jgi:hypothetical protein|nr:hypothetical protein [Longimicrobium sp.]